LRGQGLWRLRTLRGVWCLRRVWRLRSLWRVRPLWRRRRDDRMRDPTGGLQSLRGQGLWRLRRM